MTTPRIYQDINCIYRPVLLLLIDISANCTCKLKLSNFALTDVHFFMGTDDFKLCGNIQNTATQNNEFSLYTDFLLHSTRGNAKQLHPSSKLHLNKNSSQILL
jgi:hypothetical protein